MESSFAVNSTPGAVTDAITAVIEREKAGPLWKTGFVLSAIFLFILLGCTTMLFIYSVGIWGVNIPVAWGFAIVNFVWWIGIGHAGTFISAFLILSRQRWRNSINRFAEAMTLFAVACAGLFPVLHLGRPWRVYWLAPYPNTLLLWPQFRSALIWDEFAVATYFTVSLLFWYVGLIPDLATLRDHAASKLKKIVYGIFALGWRGAATHWAYYDTAYLVLAGLATPLVVSVHSIVSTDFASAQVMGWHDTIFPPYFVAGAIFSGFAMVLTVCIPLRHFYNLKSFITDRHLDNMAKIMLATGLIVTYGYFFETFNGWFGGNPYERYMLYNRITGSYAPFVWLLLLCNVVAPQLLWSPKLRQNAVFLFIISLVINLGMWLERFMIVITSLHRDYLPSAWAMYYPTIWDIGTLFGSLGLFFFLLFLFIRLLPVISIHEMRELCHEK